MNAPALTQTEVETLEKMGIAAKKAEFRGRGKN